MSVLEVFNVICEVIFIFMWSVGFYTQLFETYKTKTGESFSLNYQFLFVVSTVYFTANNIYLCFKSFDFITFIDAFYGVHALLIGSIVFGLTIYYPRKINKLNFYPIVTISISVGMIAFYYFYGVQQNITNYDQFVLFMGLSKVLITMQKYCYQIFLFYDTKSTYGVSLANFLFDFIGGVASLLQIFIQKIIDPNYEAFNIPKLGMSIVTIVFESIILFQILFVYPKKNQKIQLNFQLQKYYQILANQQIVIIIQMHKIKLLRNKFSVKIPNINNIKKGWNQFSEDYKNMLEKVVAKESYKVMENFQIFDKHYKNVLDIGCGSAQLSKLILYYHSNQIKQIFCTDLSENMIQLAQQETRDCKVKFKLLQIENLTDQFDENSFDLIYSNLVLHLVPDYRIGLKNISKIAMPNCTVMLSVLGNREKCTYFNTVNKIIEKYVQNEQKMRSINHINENLDTFKSDMTSNKIHIIKQVKKIINLQLENDFVAKTLQIPSNKALIKNLSQQKFQQLKKDFENQINDLEEKTLQLEIIYFLCKVIKQIN